MVTLNAPKRVCKKSTCGAAPIHRYDPWIMRIDQEIQKASARGMSKRSISKALGVSYGKVGRVLANAKREPSEIARALAVSVRAPNTRVSADSWSLEAIRSARDDQMRGKFKQPVALARAMRTDDALFVAYHNRIAPQSAIACLLEAYPGVRGEAVAKRARIDVSAPRSVIEGIAGTMANHGVAVGSVELTYDDEGTRGCMALSEWPLEHVYWDESKRTLMTRLEIGDDVPIVHGDGKWVVFRKVRELPWTQEACILPGAMIYAAHSDGIRDWAQASTSHGQAKIVGELAEGVALLEGDENTLSPEAASFLAMLQDLVSGEAGAGIKPFGSSVDFVSNGSTAWQVFSELIINREKAAARVYLGTDAILGAVGGAPGVDISALFGVASTKIQGDFEAIEQALLTGLYEPWTILNFGEARYSPRPRYQMPDADAERKSLAQGEAWTRLLETIEKMRKMQLHVDQSVVDALATLYGLDFRPVLASIESAAVPIDLASTDIARVVRVREARASRQLPPLGDARDDMFISELEGLAQAKADAATAEAEARAAAEAAAPTAPAV